MAEDGPHAGDSIQGPVPEDLGFEFGLLCVSSVGKHLSEVPADDGVGSPVNKVECEKVNKVVEGEINMERKDITIDELGPDFEYLEDAGELLRVAIKGLNSNVDGVGPTGVGELGPTDVEGIRLVSVGGLDATDDAGFGSSGGVFCEVYDSEHDVNLNIDQENDEDCFLYHVGLTSDVDNEVDNIRMTLIRKYVDVGGDVVEEDVLIERDGKLEDHKSEYIDSSNPGEYGDDDKSDQEICGTFFGIKTIGPRHDPQCGIPTWELGIRFEDNIQFKEAVKKYSVAKGVKLRFLKNEPLRTHVCCKEKCPWKLYASHDKRFDCYVLKTYNPMHKCYRSNKNTMLSCKMIKKKFRDRILMEPKMKISTPQEMCKSELEVYATYNMCQRAKSDVLKEKQGSYVEEFASLWGYAAELLHSNPGSTITIQVDRDNAGVTGEQLLNPGFASERVVTTPTTVPKKIGSQIS
ncbi:hypothetical protein V6N11_028946 [Hibiscus sabdariffa]|uniref:Transposase MuDR plant domain-containing protein n=1 Tax=Hibiscus sabdariffa TaxID=183260 RepID=A0ABR2N834_9ROSI